MTTDTSNSQVPTVKKKRGPKKKVWSPQIRAQRQMVRRNRANARERQRMHGLNGSLELLRSACPMFANQRLSKIDILRFARNYIKTLSEILQTGREPDILDYARALTKDLSQGTVNLIAGHLQVSPHLLWYPDTVLISDHYVYSLYHEPGNIPRPLPLPFLPTSMQESVENNFVSQNVNTSAPYNQPQGSIEETSYLHRRLLQSDMMARPERPANSGMDYLVQDFYGARTMPERTPTHENGFSSSNLRF